MPYKSTPQGLNDLLAGRVSMMFVDFTTGIPHVRAGTLRALAVTRIKRSSLFPELPTMDEAGVTGFDMDAWAGFVAPAHTPPEVVTLLNKEMRKIIDDPKMKETLQQGGLRGVLELARGAGGLHQGPARQVEKDGRGRRHPAGVTSLGLLSVQAIAT